MIDCPRLGRWIGGCKFRPRYDQVPPTAAQIEALGPFPFNMDLQALTAQRYVADVCETCGKMLFERTSSAKPVSPPRSGMA